MSNGKTPPPGKDASPSIQELVDRLERARERLRRFHLRKRPAVLGEEIEKLLNKLGRDRQ